MMRCLLKGSRLGGEGCVNIQRPARDAGSIQTTADLIEEDTEGVKGRDKVTVLKRVVGFFILTDKCICQYKKLKIFSFIKLKFYFFMF